MHKKQLQSSITSRPRTSERKKAAIDLSHTVVLKSISRGVDGVSAIETADLGSIPSRIQPNAIKIGIYSFPA